MPSVGSCRVLLHHCSLQIPLFPSSFLHFILYSILRSPTLHHNTSKQERLLHKGPEQHADSDLSSQNAFCKCHSSPHISQRSSEVDISFAELSGYIFWLKTLRHDFIPRRFSLFLFSGYIYRFRDREHTARHQSRSRRWLPFSLPYAADLKRCSDICDRIFKKRQAILIHIHFTHDLLSYLHSLSPVLLIRKFQ